MQETLLDGNLFVSLSPLLIPFCYLLTHFRFLFGVYRSGCIYICTFVHKRAPTNIWRRHIAIFLFIWVFADNSAWWITIAITSPSTVHKYQWHLFMCACACVSLYIYIYEYTYLPQLHLIFYPKRCTLGIVAITMMFKNIRRKNLYLKQRQVRDSNTLYANRKYPWKCTIIEQKYMSYFLFLIFRQYGCVFGCVCVYSYIYAIIQWCWWWWWYFSSTIHSPLRQLKENL